MTKFIYLSFIAILFTACNRDESGLDDYELFGRLQAGSGTWEVVSVTTELNDQKSPEVKDITPENVFYHFYMQTEFISSVIIDYNGYALYQNETMVKKGDIDAERQRVVFDAIQIGSGEVWTVDINNARSQVWNQVDGNITTTMRVER